MAAKRVYQVAVLALALLGGAAPAFGALYEWSRLGRLHGTTGPEPAIAALAAHPTDPGTIYAGALLTTEGAALFYSTTDGGRSWRAGAGLPDDMAPNTGIEDLLVVPGDPPALYAAVHQRGVWRSDDGGANWADASGGSLGGDADVASLAYAPGDPPTVYALATDGVHRLGASGKWAARREGLPEPGAAVFDDLAVDPVAPDTLYVASSPLGLFRSRDGGLTWEDGNGDLPGGTRNVKGVSVDAGGAAFVTLRGAGLFRSVDGGDTWSNAQQGITFKTTLFGTVSAPVFDPAEPNVAFAYNNDGVFRTEDGGVTWTPYSTGLSPTAFISMLAFQPARPHTTLGGTSISGVWTVTDAPGGRYYVPLIRR